MNRTIVFSGALLALVGCGDDGDGGGAGNLELGLNQEETIVEGLQPGSPGDGEAILDGYTVTFDKHIVAVGNVELSLATAPDTVVASDMTVVVADLTQTAETGIPLAGFPGLEETRYEVAYQTPAATSDSMRDPSVSQADFDEMVANGWSYLVEGSISRDGTTTTFRFGVDAIAQFELCEADEEVTGVAVGGSSTANLTIHGDHIFFNGFPEGEEGGVVRRAAWLEAADTNMDGETTRAELEALTPGEILTDPDDGLPGFDLAGSPLPLDNLWEYVRAQMITQGHFQGEGECEFSAIGG